MAKRIDCDRCMRVYREFRPAIVKISGENYCLQCMRAEGYEVEDGELVVQPTPTNTPMGVPKVLSAPSVEEVKAHDVKSAAHVAEKKEKAMKLAPGEGCFCSTCNQRIRKDSPDGLCKECRPVPLKGYKPTPKKPGPKPKAKPAQTSAAPTVVVDATQHDQLDRVTIEVPASFIAEYWERLSLTEQAQLVNRHMLEARP